MKTKSLLLLMSAALISASLDAQTIPQNEPVVVYYMPKTVVAIDIDYTETTVTPGVFYQYAERYLMTKEAPKEAEHYFSIDKVQMSTKTVADTSRAYVLSEKQLATMNISLTPFNTLAAINTEPATYCQKTTPHKKDKKQCNETACQKQTVSLMPLLEDQMLANSTQKMAEGTARLIYRIRESRLNILSGDAEQIPHDGKALELTLRELDRQEKELTRLFIGTTETKHHHKTIFFTPDTTQADEVIIARFSKHTGIVSVQDMSGEPLYLSINKVIRTAAQNTNQNAQKKTYSIYYNIPGSAYFNVYSMKDNFAELDCLVAQYGVAIPVSDTTLKNKAQLTFDINTGNIKGTHK